MGIQRREKQIISKMNNMTEITEYWHRNCSEANVLNGLTPLNPVTTKHECIKCHKPIEIHNDLWESKVIKI
jgi:hypothetical protein